MEAIPKTSSTTFDKNPFSVRTLNKFCVRLVIENLSNSIIWQDIKQIKLKLWTDACFVLLWAFDRNSIPHEVSGHLVHSRGSYWIVLYWSHHYKNCCVHNLVSMSLIQMQKKNWKNKKMYDWIKKNSYRHKSYSIGAFNWLFHICYFFSTIRFEIMKYRQQSI